MPSDAGFWTFNDLKEQHAVYEAIVEADPQNPARHFYVGMTMQMAGQHTSAKQHYKAFCRECIAHFGGIDSAIDHHEARLRQIRVKENSRDDRETYNAQEMLNHLQNYNRNSANKVDMENCNCIIT